MPRYAKTFVIAGGLLLSAGIHSASAPMVTARVAAGRVIVWFDLQPPHFDDVLTAVETCQKTVV
jgi:hypothetical protein